jgi:multidrug efflux pump subunit AcrB
VSPIRVSRINGQRAITFNVFKQQDANIVAAGDAVKQPRSASCASSCRPMSSCA